MGDLGFIVGCVLLGLLFVGEPDLFDKTREYLMNKVEVTKCEKLNE